MSPADMAPSILLLEADDAPCAVHVGIVTPGWWPRAPGALQPAPAPQRRL